MPFEVVSELPATMRFDRHTIYTFARGPNAGRALKYTGPGESPFEDMVHVCTADGLPFESPNGKRDGQRAGVVYPHDLVPK